MIWHITEVFLLVAVAFACGCFVGALVHAHFAAGRHRARQEALAEGVGRVIDSGARGARSVAGSAASGSAVLFKRSPSAPAPAPKPQFEGPLKTHDEHKAELEQVLASLKGRTASAEPAIVEAKDDTVGKEPEKPA